jgi:hypothetical protein
VREGYCFVCETRLFVSSTNINLIDHSHLTLWTDTCSSICCDAAKHNAPALYLKGPRFKSWPEGWLCRHIFSELDVHESVHCDIIMKVINEMQLYRLTYYSQSALHVSGDVFAHHQEHLTVFTVSGSIHPSSCWLVSCVSWNCEAQLIFVLHLT